MNTRFKDLQELILLLSAEHKAQEQKQAFAGEGRLNTLIDELIEQNKLNEKMPDGRFKDESALDWLAGYPNGRERIISNPKIRQQLNSAVFCAPLNHGPDKGRSPLSYFCGNDRGATFLLENLDLLKSLSAEGFNSFYHGGNSVAYWLIATKFGRDILDALPKWTEWLSADCLNKTGKEGDSALYWMASSPWGRQQLLNNPQLRAKIRPQGLNVILTMKGYEGHSALYPLMGDVNTRKFFCKDPAFPAMINEEALNAATASQRSALCFIAGTPEGRLMLKENPPLVAKISSAGLNRSGNDRSSAFYFLSESEDGRQLLLNSPHLRQLVLADNQSKNMNTRPLYLLELMNLLEAENKAHEQKQVFAQETRLNTLIDELIKQNKLNETVPDGMFKGESALYWLAGYSGGRERIVTNSKISREINSAVFCAPLNHGPDKGRSPLSYFCGNDRGATFLLENLDLLKSLSAEGFNSFYHGGSSVAYWLISTKFGRDILDALPKWTEWLSADCLNKTGKEGDSALYWMASSPWGRQQLLNNPQLRAKIQPQGLNAILTMKGYEGYSALYQLMGDVSTRKFFCKDPAFPAMINEEALNAATASQRSALCFIAGTPEGRLMLNGNPQLVAKISSAGLNRNRDDNAGSPFFWLSVEKVGQSILNGNLHLLAMVSSQALFAPEEAKDPKGRTAFTNLQNHPTLLPKILLAWNPMLLTAELSEIDSVNPDQKPYVQHTVLKDLLSQEICFKDPTWAAAAIRTYVEASREYQRLEKAGSDTTGLNDILKATLALMIKPSLENQTALHELIADCRDASSFSMEFLGALMVLAGLATAALGVAATFATAGLSTKAGLGAGAALFTIGVGMFYYGQKEGLLTQSFNGMAELAESLPVPPL